MQDRIKMLMESQHMNQQAFANLTGIATASLSNIYGGRTRPTLNHVEALMKSFPTLNINWLLTGDGEMFCVSTPQDSSAGLDLFGTDNSQILAESNASSTQSTTDKMAEPILPFAEESPKTIIGQNFQSYQNPPRRVEQPVHQAPASKNNYTGVNVVPTVSPSTRKITEIRVFYDDQTWESFVPKK